MAPKACMSKKKFAYDQKLCKLLNECTKILVSSADHVRSNQLQQIRKGLRGDSVVLMGKNTMMIRSIRMHSKNTGNTALLDIIPLLVGNVGLIFTKGDLKEVRKKVEKYKVGVPARVGMVAPIEVIIPIGNTGLDPSHTTFFQVLNIPTRINKGAIEIITPIELIKKGEKIGPSEATLLSKLDIQPFSFGLIVKSVYDNGSVFSAKVFDLTEDVLLEKFANGLSMVTSLALAVSYPVLAATQHMLIHGYRNLLAVAETTKYSFPEADKYKECIKAKTTKYSSPESGKVKEYIKDPITVAPSVAPVYETLTEFKASCKEKYGDDYNLFDKLVESVGWISFNARGEFPR